LKLRQGYEVEAEDEDDYYLQRMDAGLFTLQLADYIIGIICKMDPEIKSKIKELLELQSGSFDDIKTILQEYASNIGTANSEEDAKKQKDKILNVLEAL